MISIVTIDVVKSMKKQIMIVDDDKDILFTIKTVFEHEGHEVITVDNGRDCIDKVEKGFQGIIFIDIQMPELDGWETIKEIIERGYKQNVDIFVITAIGTYKRDKIHGLEPYISDYIAKPFNVVDLIKSVERLK